jgi:hypothetical protein
MAHGKIKYDSRKVKIILLCMIFFVVNSTFAIFAQNISRDEVRVEYAGVLFTVGGDFNAFKDELINRNIDFEEELVLHQDWQPENDWRRVSDDYPNPDFDKYVIVTEGLIVQRYRGNQEIVAIIVSNDIAKLTEFQLSVGDLLPDFSNYYLREYPDRTLITSNPPNPNSPILAFHHDQEYIISEITISVVSRLYNVEGQK